jgi:site-specific DNA-cytosine methylase
VNTIELFCGTKSFSKVAKSLGHETFTVDNDEYFKPDICKDILQLKRKDLPKQIDMVWASPPCTCFSVASIGLSWCGNYCPKRVETALGIAYVLKTLKLIEEIKPKYWFIENPRGVLRKMAFMEDLPRHTITYCQYGDNRMKPTDIWTNFDWKPKPMCKNGDKCHEYAPRGSKTGTQGLKGKIERGIIPRELFIEIFKQLEERGV